MSVIILKSLKAEDHQSCEKPTVEKEFGQSCGVCCNNSSPSASLLDLHRVFQVKISHRAGQESEM